MSEIGWFAVWPLLSEETGMKLRPYDLGIWFSEIDVNVLSAQEADELAQFDVSTDAGLEKMVREWVAPRFATNDDLNQRQMREVLFMSHQWSDVEIESVFGEFACPAEGKLEADRLMSVLRKVFLA
ncbi:MAG TPA: hypothetical protein VFG14_10650 [Chthoniobacteraceae bacterium]|nr:hypothetical protein [Chthoniobacteraceae bacterium]